MMKKLIMLLTICMMCLLAVSASAAEKNDEAPPINWEISMMPKPTAEEIEAARWSIVLENTMGVYAYDMDSLYFPEEKNGVVNKDLVNVVVKTVFTDKELLKKMNKTYAEKLAKKEKVQYCEMLMQFNAADKTYGVKQMDVYGSKGTKLETKINNGELIPVPEKTFAEAMLEICLQAVNNTSQAVSDVPNCPKIIKNR
ncbi:hypothetical protein [Phascolarctobacterium faecium]|uniref:hypothetical protein n=2 Tax=Phascolarctobacterium faecium TaxID=33025 RepID=UPI003AB83246